MSDETTQDTADGSERREPASSRPWYWIYRAEKDLGIKNAWNRWARGAFKEQEIEAALLEAEKDDALNNQTKESLKNWWREFQSLNPLDNEEETRIIEKYTPDCLAYCIKKNISTSSLPEPKKQIDFYATIWQEHTVFHRYIFPSRTRFDGASFQERIGFSQVVFNSILNIRGIFEKDAFFIQSFFRGEGNFSLSSFKGDARFMDVFFKEYADFSNARFFSGIDCRDAFFQENASFSFSLFRKPSRFSGVSFEQSVNFRHTTIHADIDFLNTVIKKSIDFTQADIHAGLIFTYTDLRDAKFISFVGTTFDSAKTGQCYLHFTGVPHGIINFSDSNITQTKFPALLPIDNNATKDAGKGGASIASWNYLKHDMKKQEMFEEELFFFSMELKARKEIAGKEGNKWLAWLIGAYEWLCDYGRDYVHPLKLLFTLFACSFLLYFLIFSFNFSDKTSGGSLLNQVLYVAVYNTLPLLPKDLETHRALYNIPRLCNKNGISVATGTNTGTFRAHDAQASHTFCISLLNLISTLQNAVAFLLLFLLGLCIRNKLRIK